MTAKWVPEPIGRMGRSAWMIDDRAVTSSIGPTTYCTRSATWLSRSPMAPLPENSFWNRHDRAPLGSEA